MDMAKLVFTSQTHPAPHLGLSAPFYPVSWFLWIWSKSDYSQVSIFHEHGTQQLDPIFVVWQQ